MRAICSQLLFKLLESVPSGSEYLERELSQHIEGWLSASCVRNMLLRARDVWQSTRASGLHCPGFIPKLDCQDIFRLLVWLARGDTNEYTTSSSDTFCFAKIMAELGFQVCTTDSPSRRFDDGQLVLTFNKSGLHSSRTEEVLSNHRHGIRVPLSHMEEAISLWPVDRATSSSLRNVFMDGVRATSYVRLKLASSDMYNTSGEATSSTNLGSVGLMYHIQMKVGSADAMEAYHADNDTSQLMDWLFPARTARLWKALTKLTRPWDSNERRRFHYDLEHFGGEFSDVHNSAKPFGGKGQLMRDELQVFVLGYYYALILPLITTTHLTIQEACGSWGWHDIDAIYFFMALVQRRSRRQLHSEVRWFFHRHDVLRAAAYLFAGVDDDQLEALNPDTSIGVIGKLSLLHLSILGGPCAIDDFGKFVLLDLDSSVIPSNVKGIVSAGRMGPVELTDALMGRSPVDNIKKHLLTKTEDFTSHIEPDWDHDVQACLVAYRYKGRVIHRANIEQRERSLWHWICKRMKAGAGEDTKLVEASDFEAVALEGFHGGRLMCPSSRMAILVPSYHHPKAFFCILGMCHQLNKRSELAIVSSPEDVTLALDQGKGMLISADPTFMESTDVRDENFWVGLLGT